MKWVDKKKGLAYLSSASHYVQQEIDKQNLSSASKIINGFENPVIKDENLSREGEGAYTDDELSLMNDPVAKTFGKSQRTRKQRAAFAARERENMEATVRDLAEDMNFDEAVNEGFWDRIRSAVVRALNAVGINIRSGITDKEIRYMLWRSYGRLASGEDILSDAEDIAMQHRLGVGNYADNLFRDGDDKGPDDGGDNPSGGTKDLLDVAERNSLAVKDVESRTRINSFNERNGEDAARMYEAAVSNYHRRLRETLVDMYASVEDLMQSIAKATGKPVKSFENVMRSLNQQTSKGSEMEREWTNRIWVPLSDCIRGIVSDTDMSFDDVNRYVMLKHGLERNRKYALRDARKYYDEWLIRTIVS